MIKRSRHPTRHRNRVGERGLALLDACRYLRKDSSLLGRCNANLGSINHRLCIGGSSHDACGKSSQGLTEQVAGLLLFIVWRQPPLVLRLGRKESAGLLLLGLLLGSQGAC